MYLLVHNIQKKNNIGMLVRSACAFNVDRIFTVIWGEEKKELKFS
jgi:tRNA G18 (ribose-2'-O)-methylase SpoU